MLAGYAAGPGFCFVLVCLFAFKAHIWSRKDAGREERKANVVCPVVHGYGLQESQGPSIFFSSFLLPARRSGGGGGGGSWNPSLISSMNMNDANEFKAGTLAHFGANFVFPSLIKR